MCKCAHVKQEFHSLLTPFPFSLKKRIFHSYYIGYRSQSYRTQTIPQLAALIHIEHLQASEMDTCSQSERLQVKDITIDLAAF